MAQYINVKIIQLLTPEELELAYYVRRVVYVDEFKCSKNSVIDKYDKLSETWAAVADYTDDEGNILKKNVPVGTIRLFPLPDNVVRLGRLAVIADARRMSIGKKLILLSVEYARSKGYDSIVLHAFSDKRSFYQKLGFKLEEGDDKEFIENGPPLVRLWMRQLQNV